MVGWICYLVQAPLQCSSGDALDVNLQINRSYGYVAVLSISLVLVFAYC